MAILNDYEILGPPPPPRNSSKHVIAPTGLSNTGVQTKVNGYCSSNGENGIDQRHNENQSQNSMNTNNNDTNCNGRCKPSSIAEANAISKYEFFGFDPRNSGEFSDTPSYQNINKLSSLKNSNESLPPNKGKSNKDEGTASSPTTKANSVFGSDPSWSNPTVDLIKLNGEYSKKSPAKNGEYTTEQLMSQLEAIVRGSPHISPIKDTDREIIVASPDRNSGKFILPLPDSPTQVQSTMEIQSNLRMERTQLVANLTTLKAKVMEIEQQEEELMREVINFLSTL